MLEFTIHSCYGNFERDDFGTSVPFDIEFAFPLLLGNLLQQTYSLMDAAIVGKFLGINALASVGASTSVVLF